MDMSSWVIDKDSTLKVALEKIDKNKNNFLLCIDNNSKIVGIITDGDIRRYLIHNNSLAVLINKIMTTSFEYVLVTDSFSKIAEKFKSDKIKFLPIVDSNNILINFITKKQFHVMLLEDIKFNLEEDFSHFDTVTLEHEIYNRPWGFYKSTIYTDHAQAKVITIFLNEELSLQEHKKREEHWVIIKGVGKVVLGESVLSVYPGKYIYIPKGCKHQMINTSNSENLVFSEVQLGNYFGEDDIIRYSDKYNRT